MRKIALMGAVLIGMVVAAPAPAEVRNTQLVTIHPEGIASIRGIGPVRLEESQAAVTAALGTGHEVESGFSFGDTYAGYNYRTGGITIEVAYTGGVVSGVSTKSPGAMLLGHRLAEGLATFRSILRHRLHWRIDTCHHRVFTALAPGGPGTGIEWRAGRVELVMIDVGGVLDGCAVL
jgi:hypothetical protein